MLPEFLLRRATEFSHKLGSDRVTLRYLLAAQQFLPVSYVARALYWEAFSETQPGRSGSRFRICTALHQILSSILFQLPEFSGDQIAAQRT